MTSEEISQICNPAGVRYVDALPYGAKVVGMTQCNGRIYVATEDAVYWLDGEALRKVELADGK